jgi:hypothetical protein
LFFSLLGRSASAQTSAGGQASSPPLARPTAAPAISVDELARRLQRLENENKKLADQNKALVRRIEAVTAQYEALNQRMQRIEPAGESPVTALPPPLPPGAAASLGAERPPRAGPGVIQDQGIPSGASATGTDGLADITPADNGWFSPERPSYSRFLVGEYDDDSGSFVLVRPKDAQSVPFELRVDLITQARYSNFARSKPTWIDSTGAVLPVHNFDTVEVTRNFIQFSGFGIDPRLQYTAIIFSSTAINDTVYLGWINYHFSDAFDLRVGNWLVPGTREWYESFRYTLGADRLMATTFFRPNISPGIWAQGEPIQNLHYVAMVANSLNRFTQGVNRIGSSLAFGGTLRWEPQGAFGRGPSDIENNEALRTRLGTSVAISREANQGFGDIGVNNPEDTILRLSNGTPLFRPGALGPGVLLQSAQVQLWTIDAALKYRGLSVSGEYFFRWLDGFQSSGGRSPFGSIFDTGGLLQAGYFWIPSKLETYARTSFVTGRFGAGEEYGVGVNWYPRGTREWRFTFEVLRINNSPAENLLTGYRAGESGTLFQLQWLTDF